MRKWLIRLIVVGFGLTLVIPSRAEDLRLANLFSDHMVLQREKPVPVWGWAKPGEEVTVEFAERKAKARADANGRWMVTLDPMPASTEGHDLVTHSSREEKKLTITDVVVGDVWLCSGQSNMHFGMKRVENAKAEIAAANNPAIRFFYVKEQFAQQPADHVEGEWKPISPETVVNCSAVAYYFASALQEKLGVPIGLLLSSVGGTRIETWMRQETLSDLGIAGRLIDQWKNVSPAEFEEINTAYRAYQAERDRPTRQLTPAAEDPGAAASVEPKRPTLRCHDCPGALHNCMIAPLQPFAIRGALWYQGEANIGSPGGYEKMLPALITDWRRVWGDKMPFLIVQLAPHKSTTPAFREAQFRVSQKTPHTAMVVTTDVGHAEDIHPTRKRPVGERLALAARAVAYGERVEVSGPVFKSLKIDGRVAVVSFSHAEAGLKAEGGPLKGFTIAGKDGKFIAADAEIRGSTVVVSSEQIDRPVAVRYGWDNVPDVNLFNREGLPAVPFRSDQPGDQSRLADPKH